MTNLANSHRPTLARSVILMTLAMLTSNVGLFLIDFTVVRGYGRSTHGQLSWVLSLISLLAVLSHLGLLSTAGIRQVARQRAEDPSRLGQLISTTIGLPTWMSIVVALAVIALAEPISHMHAKADPNWIRLLATWIVLMGGARISRMIATGLERIWYVWLTAGLYEIARLAWLVVCVVFGLDPWSLLVGWTGVTGLTLAVSIWAIARMGRQHGFRIRLEGISAAGALRLVHFALGYFLPTLWAICLPNVLVLAVGRWHEDAVVSLLRICISWSLFSRLLVQPLTGAMLPRLAWADAASPEEFARMGRALSQTQRIAGLIGTLSFAGFWALGSWVLGLLYGASYSMGWPVLVMLGLAIGMDNYSQVLDQILLATRYVRAVAWLEGLKAALLAAGLVLLVPRWGAFGAASSVAICLVVATVIKAVFANRVLKQVTLSPLATGLVCFAAVSAVGFWSRHPVVVLGAWLVAAFGTGLLRPAEVMDWFATVLRTAGLRKPAQPGDQALARGRSALPDLPPMLAKAGLVCCLLLAGALLAKQIVLAKVATQDAAGYYLPIAGEVGRVGAWAAQHAMIPPLYSTLVGWAAPLVHGSDDPLALAGRLISAVAMLGLIGCIYAIGKLLWNSRVGLVAAALTAANPYMIFTGANIDPGMTYALLLGMAVLAVLLYVRRPCVWLAAASGALAALAALARSEGVFLLPLVGLVVLGGAVQAKAGIWRTLLHVVLLIVVALGVWAPRMTWMNQRTGHPVLDVRSLRYLPVDPGRDMTALRRLPADVDHLPAARASDSKTPLRRLTETSQDLLMVFGPLSWGLIVLWLIVPKSLRRRWGSQAVLLAAVLGELAIVTRVKSSTRYLSTVAGLVQLWAALGMVELAGLMRSMTALGGLPARIGNSLRLQLGLLGAMVAALAVWSLLMTNVGSRHTELREAGLAIRRQMGPGKVLLSTSVEAVYYAQGLRLAVDEDAASAVLAEDLAQACRKHAVDLVLVRSGEKWCPLPADPKDEGFSDGLLMTFSDAGKSGKGDRIYVFDAHRLLDRLAATSVAADGNHP